MCRAQSGCGGLLPAPAEQAKYAEAGGEERQSTGKRCRNPSERKGSVESPRSDDIRSNAEPVWIKGLVTCPTLQICKAYWECCVWTSARQPEELADVASGIDLHLGHEEVVIWRKIDGYLEGYRELYLYPGDWPGAAPLENDASRLNRILCCKRQIQHGRRNAEVS